jgi:cation:H+ antiporter
LTLTSLATFVIGIVALVAGAEGLVRGAARIAARTGLSSVVIGLTVVAFGTSTPELAVSASAVLNGSTDLAIGNVVGSNIANVLLILGLSALVGGGLVVAQRLVRIDVPIMIGASVLILLLSLDGTLGRIEGAALVGLILTYTVWTVRSARAESAAVTAEYDDALDPESLRRTPLMVDIAFVVVGVGLLIGGARWMVNSASTMAADLGASDLIIGLTIVAIGTSMPELATSVLAAIRGERDIAVGNAVGSNIFNLLAVLGVSAVLADGGIVVLETVQKFDLPVMTAVAVACLPVFLTGYLLSRWEGAVFVAYYVAYVTYLVLDATDATAFEPFRAAMVGFVVPLTLLTLGVVGFRSWRRRAEAGA